ncbi:hypothetical protein [Priestia megaterium]|uniref:hypothetical protein n=1 Tax=Priestia megaterium TaxID=1404 RepID=UPI00159BE339|nr:hypothetical protein [Priestia megaterium]
MPRVKVVKASTAHTLQDDINKVLRELSGKYIDIKLAGGYDGTHEVFTAVIIYE